MTRATFLVNDVIRTANMDAPRRRADIRQAILWGQVVDELTGAPVTGRVRVSTTTPGLTGGGHAASGVVGLVGIPSRVVPALNTTAYDIDLHVLVGGYMAVEHHAELAAQPGFPTDFAAKDVGQLLLRRLPVMLEVYVYELDGQHRQQPAVGADVTITRVWRRAQDQNRAGDDASALNLHATTSADGLARLPELSRVAFVQVKATKDGNVATVQAAPDYTQHTTTLHLVLPT